MENSKEKLHSIVYSDFFFNFLRQFKVSRRFVLLRMSYHPATISWIILSWSVSLSFRLIIDPEELKLRFKQKRDDGD